MIILFLSKLKNTSYLMNECVVNYVNHLYNILFLKLKEIITPFKHDTVKETCAGNTSVN